LVILVLTLQQCTKPAIDNDFYAVLFLALLSVLAMVLVLILGHDNKAEHGALVPTP
jgi:ACS family tartrate transporter-like MFS transporter